MSYLSKVIISRRDAAKQYLRDSYAWHQAIWKSFPERDGEKRDFLFRVDIQDDTFRAYILSGEKPVVPEWGSWRTKEVAPSFLEHDRYRFQLKANPTMRRSSDKRRLGIWQEDRLHGWIRRKARQNGFSLDENHLRVSAAIEERFRQKNRRGKHIAVPFQGILKVTDRKAFKAGFHKGIGSAKGFGFGLLMLQPIN